MDLFTASPRPAQFTNQYYTVLRAVTQQDSQLQSFFILSYCPELSVAGGRNGEQFDVTSETMQVFKGLYRLNHRHRRYLYMSLVLVRLTHL